MSKFFRIVGFPFRFVLVVLIALFAVVLCLLIPSYAREDYSVWEWLLDILLGVD